MKVLALIAATTIIATTTGASAYDYRQAQIDARRVQENYRINTDRARGDLTLVEKWRLKAEQARIADMERRALSDGHISRHESYQINQALNRASGHIYQESHDSQVAWWRRS